MRIIFAGTPDFSVTILKALIKAGHDIIAVYSQPDRPKGRGQAVGSCPVKICANAYNLPTYQPSNLNNAQTELSKLAAEVMVVVAYGQILPVQVLHLPKYGCLNIHASLLPRWRGAAPIQRAILAGDQTTGVSIMQMDEGLDTGDILLEKKCAITNTDTAQSLHDKLAILAAKSILEVLDKIDSVSPNMQNKQGITYAKKLIKNEAWIDWTQSAKKIHQQIRAFNPYPIAQTNAAGNKFNAKVLRILSASIIDQKHNTNPGEVIKCNQGVCYVATGDGVLSLEKVQLSGKNPLAIKDFINAYQLTGLSSD